MKKSEKVLIKYKNILTKNLSIEKIIFAACSSVIFFILLYFYTHGFIPHDEGWIINPAARILYGDIPYRDFHYIYTPGVAYSNALVFKLFGISILTSRIFTMGIALLTVLLFYKISLSISDKRYYSLLPISIYLTWGPMHINFAWPIIYTIFSGLLCIYLLLVAKEKEKVSYFFFAGVAAGLTILFKQNFGAALLCNIILFFILTKEVRKVQYLTSLIGGVLILPVIMCIYFMMNQAFIPFIQDMYFFMIDQIYLKGMQKTQFIYPDIWYKQIAKTFFYLIPLIVSGYASIISVKYNKSFLFLSGMCFWYYLFGIRPTTDYVHLTGLMALIGIPIIQILVSDVKQIVKITLLLLTGILVVVGIYTSLFRNYYRWDTPLIYQNNFIENPTVRISTDAIYMKVIPEVSNYIKSTTSQNDPIFIYTFSPSFYLITNRRNPTKYIFAPPQLLSLNDQEEIVKNLIDNNVKLILADIRLQDDHSFLSRYIQKHYKEVKHVNNYTFWKK